MEMKNETCITNIFRPYRAGRRVDVFLGLKPQAESYRPFGAETGCSACLVLMEYNNRLHVCVDMTVDIPYLFPQPWRSQHSQNRGLRGIPRRSRNPPTLKKRRPTNRRDRHLRSSIERAVAHPSPRRNCPADSLESWPMYRKHRCSS